MRIFKNRPFVRFAQRNLIGDSDLYKAIESANRGLIGADLGGGVIKQRIARRGEGKSGGFRTLILFRKGDRAIFVHGFAKSDVENIRPDELKALRKLARELLAYNEIELRSAIASGTLVEVRWNGEDEAVS